MMMIWCFENLKIGEDLLTGKLKRFFLIFQMEREREEIGGERRAKATNQVRPRHPLAVGGRVAHTGAKAPPGRGARNLTNNQPKWPHSLGCPLARAPSVLQPVSWASDLRF